MAVRIVATVSINPGVFINTMSKKNPDRNKVMKINDRWEELNRLEHSETSSVFTR